MSFKELYGMSSRQAQDYLDMEYRMGRLPYYKIRVIWKNGEYLLINADQCRYRINVHVWYDEIVYIAGVY
jgi:hypothetical protein